MITVPLPVAVITVSLAMAVCDNCFTVSLAMAVCDNYVSLSVMTGDGCL